MRRLLWILILLLVYVPFPYIEKTKPSSPTTDSTVAAMESVETVEIEEGQDYVLYTCIDGVVVNVTRIPKVFRDMPTYYPRQIHVHPAGFTLYDTPKELRSMSYEDEFFVRELYTTLALTLNTLLYNTMVFCLIRIHFPNSPNLTGVASVLLCLVYLVFCVWGNRLKSLALIHNMSQSKEHRNFRRDDVRVQKSLVYSSATDSETTTFGRFYTGKGCQAMSHMGAFSEFCVR
ncbi:hypothetical protein AVEN_236539-2 [Araneus ventricosus]|uniref:Uncharacterized protein n=1 Tax=Araneus ventricosus TaxID=182803 RepID=A0A4Y2PCY9_ARAVE|nr:hypothetical protein AVEN_236539-2 [Araneus ventricosus]